MPHSLAPDQLERFHRDGYLLVPGAIDAGLAAAFEEEVWQEYREEHGIDREDRSTWRRPPCSPRRTKHSALNERVADERFQGIVSDLVGFDDWPRPANWGGFLATFPGEESFDQVVPSELWHWDGPPGGPGLLVFSFYSHVRPGGGGTWVLRGSHRLIEAYYAACTPEERARPHKAHRAAFSTSHPWLADLTGHSKQPVSDRAACFREGGATIEGLPCQAVELTGRPGDTVFCDLGLMHAPAPVCTGEPRLMRVKFLFLGDKNPARKPGNP